jgi:hypothetical protein
MWDISQPGLQSASLPTEEIRVNERTAIRLKRFKAYEGIAVDRMARRENPPNCGAQKIPGRENCKVYDGSEAKDAIFARLVSYPRALPLAVRVSDFYGDSLVYRESRRFSSSFYQIQLGVATLCSRVSAWI